MTARLGAVTPLVQALKAEPTASVTIPSFSDADRVVWFGGDPRPACYSVPQSVNVGLKSKRLVLLAASGGAYAAGVLGPAGALLPAAPSGCVNFSVPQSLGAGRFTLALQDVGSGQYIAGAGFDSDVMTVSISGLSYVKGVSIKLTISWAISAARASPLDTIRIFDKGGRLRSSFQTAGPGTANSTSGSRAVSFVKKSMTPAPPSGGFTVAYYPNNGKLAAAWALNWFTGWSKIGW